MASAACSAAFSREAISAVMCFSLRWASSTTSRTKEIGSERKMGNQPFISMSSILTVPAWKSTLSIFMRRPSMVNSIPKGI